MPRADGPARDLGLSEADRIDFAGGSVTVSLPGVRGALRIFVRDEGSGVGEIGFDGLRVSFSGEPIGVVRRPDGDADAASLHIELGSRATAAAVEALLESFLLEDPTGGDAGSWRALVTVADGRGRSTQSAFALRQVVTPRPPAAPTANAAPRPDAGAGERTADGDFLLADADTDCFVFDPAPRP